MKEFIEKVGADSKGIGFSSIFAKDLNKLMSSFYSNCQ